MKTSSVSSNSTQKDFYFSTLAEGKNVLQTQQPTDFVEGVLQTCQTSSLNASEITSITQLVLKLCDGSVIQALNGSSVLNVTVDSALSCIESAFDDGCTIIHTNDDSSSGYDIGYTLIGIVLVALLIYCCCCRSPNNREPQPQREDPYVSLIQEQNGILRDRYRERQGEELARIITSTACSIS